LGKGEPEPLIFDECPYKYYMVVFNGAVNFSYLPFDENGETVYKGEASLNFVCYDGWARELETIWWYHNKNDGITSLELSEESNRAGERCLDLYGRTLPGIYYTYGRYILAETTYELNGVDQKHFLCDESDSSGFLNHWTDPIVTGITDTIHTHYPVWNLGDYEVFPFIIIKKKKNGDKIDTISNNITIIHRENEDLDTQQKLIINIPNSV
jgi:hypothetical protein